MLGFGGERVVWERRAGSAGAVPGFGGERAAWERRADLCHGAGSVGYVWEMEIWREV